MIFKDYYDAIYSARVLFFANCSIEEVNKKLKSLRVPEEQYLETSGIGSSGATWIVQTKKEGVAYCVWVDNIKLPYILSHECLHLVLEIFVQRGIPISYDNQETLAYYLGFWMQLLSKAKSD